MRKKSTKLILVIDDSQDGQILLKTLGEAKGYQVQCASNGQAALLMLRELSDLPDLILLDAQMPTMDGYQFRIEQKKDSRLKNIPVIIMTGDDDIKMNEKMIQPQGILTKPLHLNTLIDSLSHFL